MEGCRSIKEMEANRFTLCLTIALFGAIFAQAKAADILVPKYDNEEKMMKFFEIRYPLVLSCNVLEGKHELTWEKNGTDVSKVDSLKNRHVIKNTENQLVIERSLETDAGDYSCSIKSLKISKTIHVIAAAVAKLPLNTPIVEGEKMSIQCYVAGTDPKVEWTIKGNISSYEFPGRISQKADENGVENAILVVENVELEDKGEYTCTVTNAAVEYGFKKPVVKSTLVRVKGKLAALWPFLGICAEVFVLCAIILIYEKRRNKSDMEDSDTDQSPETKQDHASKESELRQRK